MPLVLQAKLLRVLQEKRVRRLGGQAEIPVNCRIISATNVNPWENLKDRVIRPDLFFRLSAMILPLPTLRSRIEDIPLLLKHFVDKYNADFELTVQGAAPELLEKMMRYSWPGNVRELGNMVENAMNLIAPDQKWITWEHLPEYARLRLSQTLTLTSLAPEASLAGFRELLEDYEKNLIQRTLVGYRGNISKAATALGLVRQNLHFKIKKYGLDPKQSARR
jgi:arginine utilization regulatory protein